MESVADEYAEMGDVTDYELGQHVREALKSVKSGDTDDYDQIIGNIHNNVLTPEEVAMLVTVLRALTEAVFYIDVVYHRSLLSSVCKMSMWDYGPDVIDALAGFVVALATSSGKYIDLCLDMLVSNFIPPYSFLAILKQPRGLAKKDQVLTRIHSALKAISDLVPLAPSRLEKIVRERVPNVFSKEPQIVVYVENMLMLESGEMGELVGNSMIFELMNRLIDLDLEIGLEENSSNDPSKLDIEEDKMGQKVPLKEVAAEKLDTLMVLTFDHLQSCFNNGRLIPVFEVLLQSFEKTVLPAYKSKFTQFVIFYACSLDSEECGTLFVSRLVDFFKNTNRAPDLRISAVAYLASYLSRAKFVSASYVTIVLESLVDWCYKYCKNKNSSGINPEYHRVFYAGCQAIMNVLCFRMKSILGFPLLRSQLFNMPLERILKHALNPLAVCLPSIVVEFLKQAKAAELFHVSGAFVFHDLIESDLSRAFGGVQRLDLFFPFDPYLLEKSDSYIKPIFITWAMVTTTGDDEDDEEGMMSDEDEEEDVFDGVSNGRVSTSYEDEEFDMSLSKMSITPRDSFMFENPTMQMPSRIRPSTSP